MTVEFDEFDIEGPVLLIPTRHRDKRGVFAETFRHDDFREVVGDIDLVQENQSISVPINTIRGLHFQTSPYAQGKLVRVTKGAILDVARHSTTVANVWSAYQDRTQRGKLVPALDSGWLCTRLQNPATRHPRHVQGVKLLQSGT